MGAALGSRDALGDAMSSITLLTLSREEDERHTESTEKYSSAFQLALPSASCTDADLVMEGS